AAMASTSAAATGATTPGATEATTAGATEATTAGATEATTAGAAASTAGQEAASKSAAGRGAAESPTAVLVTMTGETFQLDHGSIVIAAITSCTNTSNPSVMLAAGILARKAVERGLRARPW